jgi:hypothetical protein
MIRIVTSGAGWQWNVVLLPTLQNFHPAALGTGSQSMIRLGSK